MAHSGRICAAIVSSRRFEGVSRELVAHLDGAVLIQTVDEARALGGRVERLVVICDWADPHPCTRAAMAVGAPATLVVSPRAYGGMLCSRFPSTARLVDLSEVDWPSLASAIRPLIAGDGDERAPVRVGRAALSAFVSHDPDNADVVEAAMDMCRQQDQLDLYVRGEAMDEEALRARDALVVFVSEASSKNPFCSFEVGFASSLNKRIVLISLDGTAAPAFVAQRAHTAVDVPAALRAKPWLTPVDVVVNSVLSGLVAAGGKTAKKHRQEGDDGNSNPIRDEFMALEPVPRVSSPHAYIIMALAIISCLLPWLYLWRGGRLFASS